MPYLNTRQGAYTLIETMLTLSIVIVLLAIAAPSFATLISSNRVTVQSNVLLESLHLARRSAVTSHKMTHICQLDDLSEHRCSTDYSGYRDWSTGWMIFQDLNRNNEYDDKDKLIRVVAGVEDTQLIFNQRGRLRFFPTGSSRSAGFTVCDAQKRHYRHVYLLHTGRARVIERITAKQKNKCDSQAAKKSR